MSELPPLRFKSILREYLWGNRRLAELGKPIGDGDHYAESWEIVDHCADQSIVDGGLFAGKSLHELVEQHQPALFGRHHPQKQFPLLFKFLDCNRTLSVQVHPNDEQAAKLDPPDLGKTEAWVVLAAEPGSRIYAGLRPGVDRAILERAIAEGNCEECLHEFEAKPGDCLLIEAGTVHALGAGLLVAEIQQASDTTFRLYDWNRVDADGKPRQLHIQQALDVIDYTRGPVNPVKPQRFNGPQIENLVSCDKFQLRRLSLDPERVEGRLSEPDQLNSDNRFHIIAAIDGCVSVHCAGAQFVLKRGDTLLIAACCTEVKLEPRDRAVLLDAYLP